jgi:site-specific DNA-methyltransferase (adenine-specific)
MEKVKNNIQDNRQADKHPVDGLVRLPFYSDEDITIINDDCLNVIDSLPPADLVLTDPPYKLSQKYGSSIDPDNLRAVSSLLLVLPKAERILKDGKFLVSFYDNRILSFLFEAARNTKLTYQKSIYLYRRWGNAHKWGGWMQTTDPICFFRKYSEQNFEWNGGDVKHDCYIKDKPEPVETGHPAQKPLEILIDIINWTTKPGDLIIDPYMGSGTTLIAAKLCGRKAVGIEQSRDYCNMAKDRILNTDLFGIAK